MVEIAGLIFQALPFADVAHERLDPQAVAPALRVRRDLDPHRRFVRAPEPQKIVGDGAVPLQTADETLARLRIDEVRDLERPHVVLGRFHTEAEHQFEMGIRGERLALIAVDRADVHALVHRLEQPGERLG